MFTIAKEELDWGGRTLTLETGRVARQADGAVLPTYGETVVLAPAVGAHERRDGEERTIAAREDRRFDGGAEFGEPGPQPGGVKENEAFRLAIEKVLKPGI